MTANTRFGFRLFGELWKEKPGENLFVSPASVAMALAMTYNGAAGQTATAMARTLELTGLSLDKVNAGNAALRENLTNLDPRVELTIANSLWAQRGHPFLPAFIAADQRFYGAEMSELNLASPEAVDAINNWVKTQTRGRIKDIVTREDLARNILLVLTNAVYFKGTWSKPFEESRTRNQPFALLDGHAKQVPLMEQRGEYDYLEQDGLQAISLPYGGRRASLYVFLPAPRSNLGGFLHTLTPQKWEAWVKAFSEQLGTIKLPRFRTECSLRLNDPLKSLGMGVAFDPKHADFSRMGAAVWIDQVKHKTFVEVNEKGIEAAAATAVPMAGGVRPMERPFTMVVDRPFFCAIRDNDTGTMLFMGAIVEPK